MPTLDISGVITGKGKVQGALNAARTKTIPARLISQYDGYDPVDCPLLAVRLVGFSPEKIINVTSYADNVWENTDVYYRSETLTLSGNYYPIGYYDNNATSATYSKFLVTDKKSENQNGIPLYYSYELFYDVSAELSSNIVSVYINDEQLVSPKDYAIEYSYDLLKDGSGRYEPTTWSTFDSTQTVHRVRLLLPITFSDQRYYVVKYKKSVFNSISQQEELIELRDLYSQGIDFSVSASGVTLVSDKIASGELYVVKDPEYRIYAKDIVALKENVGYYAWHPDQNCSWKLRLNVGTIKTQDGSYSSNSGYFYRSYSAIYEDSVLPIVNNKPDIVSSNVLKLKETPLYFDPSVYVYPYYKIDTYDKEITTLVDTSGKIAIDINGVTRTDIKVLSADRTKGYLYLNQNINPTDEVEVSYYVSGSGYFLLENLELNPKFKSGHVDFHLPSYSGGIGIALRPFDPNDSGTYYPYLFDLTTDISTRVCSLVYSIGDPALSGFTYGWSSGNFLHVCDLNINELSKDAIDIQDARIVGGGVYNKYNLRGWYRDTFSEEEKVFEREWLTDIGNYDGSPLAQNGLIVIHIPSSMLDSLKQQWIDHYYGLNNEHSFAIDKGIKEFNFYLDQVIRRYISAGTEYLLIPTDTDGNFSGIIKQLDY